MRDRIPLVVSLLVVIPMLSVSATGRTLTFIDRVSAQRAIDRVYYSHQEGARKPFEEAVPFAVSEQKVRTYLDQSLALERRWGMRLTTDALRREWRRISDQTRMPERLAELRRVLDDDPMLILESLVRPLLADRAHRRMLAAEARAVTGAHRDRSRARAHGIAKRTARDSWLSVEERFEASRDADPEGHAEMSAPLDETCISAGWNNGRLGLPGLMAPRDSHVALWTGTHMLVVGGSGTPGSFDGEKYDPVLDSAARSRHRERRRRATVSTRSGRGRR